MLVITWPQLLYVSLIVVLFYIGELVFFFFKQKKINSSFLLKNQSAEILGLKQELELIKIRLAAFAASLPADTPLTNEEPRHLASESPYAHAIRLAQTGADAPEVAAACGISRGEADLIVAIYRSAERN
ncbi:DUF2802 domain-containing protein [Deefgea piscis]|uniref:DUF2802 domain-containing protein n=1 Tax=Deefgea piscis TaxID=2739061 RepID=UPI001C800CF8|nr:DUF2802 domain-containing protein [Deefgea piscis]QZA80026.1 DUF2802 domain-containing protein [Deefgea piscis]